MRAARADQVRAALAAVPVWPPDLAPDGRYADLADLDAAATGAAMARRLGAPRRVGESALVMGLAARLWAVSVVPTVTAGVLPDLGSVRVRTDPLGLGVAEGPGWRDPSPDDVRRLVLAVLEPVVATLRLSRRLLWGDVAASLYAVPAVYALPAARPLVDLLLTSTPLAGELEATGRRRTCCLFYLVPGAGLCGDCVLDHVGTTGR